MRLSLLGSWGVKAYRQGVHVQRVTGGVQLCVFHVLSKSKGLPPHFQLRSIWVKVRRKHVYVPIYTYHFLSFFLLVPLYIMSEILPFTWVIHLHWLQRKTFFLKKGIWSGYVMSWERSLPTPRQFWEQSIIKMTVT